MFLFGADTKKVVSKLSVQQSVKSRRGLLVSLLRFFAIIVVILWMLAYLAVSSPFDGVRNDVQTVAHVFVNDMIETPLLAYRQTTGSFPYTWPGLVALIHQPAGVAGWKGPYIIIKTVPLDPWNTPYHYRFPGVHNPGRYDCWSSGPDKIDGTADDIGNW